MKKENVENSLNWEEAEKHLSRFVALYASIGWEGSFALYLTLFPLKNRFDGGEQTKELYEEIMQVE